MAPLPSRQLGLFGTNQVVAVRGRTATPCPPAPKREPSPVATPPMEPLIYWPPIVIAGAAASAVMFVAVATAALVSHLPAGHMGGAAAVPAQNPYPLAMASDAENAPTSTAAAPIESTAAAILPPAPVDPSAANKSPEPEPFGPDLALAPDAVVGGAAGAPVCAAPTGGGRYGTAVDFVDNPTDASARALRDKKLLFVLHVAGDFEEAKFT
jgi:hypothetical protein